MDSAQEMGHGLVGLFLDLERRGLIRKYFAVDARFRVMFCHLELSLGILISLENPSSDPELS